MAKKRVLMVDDDDMLLGAMAAVIQNSGRFEVRTEDSPEAALSAAREYQPDIIVLDIAMPGMDGGQVAAQFRDDPLLSSVPILFLTSIVTKHEQRERQSVVGGNYFVAKPVTSAELMAHIDRCLDAE